MNIRFTGNWSASSSFTFNRFSNLISKGYEITKQFLYDLKYNHLPHTFNKCVHVWNKNWCGRMFEKYIHFKRLFFRSCKTDNSINSARWHSHWAISYYHLYGRICLLRIFFWTSSLHTGVWWCIRLEGRMYYKYCRVAWVGGTHRRW